MTNTEQRHPDGWTLADIAPVAAVIQDCLDEMGSDVANMFFNSDVEEIAMKAWPVIERRVRERIAAQFDQAAAGRREYAVNAPERSAEVLEQQASDLDQAARLARGDMSALTAWLPSWRWTDEMTKDWAQ